MKLFWKLVCLINAGGDRVLKNKDTIIKEILIQNYIMFYRIAYSYVHNESDAQDIVQESAYKAIYHARNLKKEEFVKTWICRIVINESISFLRKQKKEQVKFTTDPLTCYSEQEENIDLRKALEQLKPEERTIIILRYFEEMKLEEIAQICKESVNTVKSRLYRTLKKLKLDLEE